MPAAAKTLTRTLKAAACAGAREAAEGAEAATLPSRLSSAAVDAARGGSAASAGASEEAEDERRSPPLMTVALNDALRSTAGKTKAMGGRRDADWSETEAAAEAVTGTMPGAGEIESTRAEEKEAEAGVMTVAGSEEVVLICD